MVTCRGGEDLLTLEFRARPSGWRPLGRPGTLWGDSYLRETLSAGLGRPRDPSGVAG